MRCIFRASAKQLWLRAKVVLTCLGLLNAIANMLNITYNEMVGAHFIRMPEKGEKE